MPPDAGAFLIGLNRLLLAFWSEMSLCCVTLDMHVDRISIPLVRLLHQERGQTRFI